MKAIGGYPELELRKGNHYHTGAIRLNTARNCLEYILLARGYRKVFIPYYTCAAVHEPFEKSVYECEMEFYSINSSLEPTGLPGLKEDEAFLYTNYFGLKQDCIETLAKRFGNKLIVDNSQAFYDLPINGVDTFYSARKFFGVPDGAYLYTDCMLKYYYGEELAKDESYDRMNALIKRIDFSVEEGYRDFQETEQSLICQPIKRMSKLTEAILGSIDYEGIRHTRRENYKNLYYRLFQNNKLWLRLDEKAVPLCYPFLSQSPELRKKLIDNRIYVPTYWPNVLEQCDASTIEYQYASLLLPLPIDQRYGKDDMKTIVKKINQNI